MIVARHKPSDLDLPASLQHRLSERHKTAARLDAAQKALSRLEAEARTCELYATQARQQASVAAVQVIGCAIESHVAEITEYEAKARDLRIELASYGATWFAGTASGPKPSPVSVAIVTLLRDPPCNIDTRSDPAIVAEFQAIHSRLLSNPDEPI